MEERDELQKFIGNESLTISEVMRKIDKNGARILFLVNNAGTVVGSLTDGDIRRFLLAGGTLSDAASAAANQCPRVARTEEEARQLYHEKYFNLIPVVDTRGKIVQIYNGNGVAGNIRPRKPLQVPVVINAGGKGTRLDPFTRVIPKPLIPVGNLPVIELIMQEYQRYSCNDFHIIVNYKRDLLKAYFAGIERNYKITWYDEVKPLGTGGGLSLLRGKLDTTFFFANCDVLLTAEYEPMLQSHRDSGNHITMVCAHKNMDIPYGVVEIGADGSILQMKEKPRMTFHVNTGIYIVEPDIINDISDNESIGFPDMIERARQNGRKVGAFAINEGDWMDMGQFTELEKMRVKLFDE